MIILEDTPELRWTGADCVQLRTTDTDPPVSMRQLVRTALRLRPDRIVVGEVRGGEAYDLIKALNTGHPGGLCTIHANSAMEGISRLEDLVAEATTIDAHRTVTSAIDLIVYMERDSSAPAGRRVLEILEVWAEGVN